MQLHDTLPVLSDSSGARRISPTDISQFLRLEQCERYLRLRLHERGSSGRFMRDYGVVPQSIPPLLTRSGATYEQTVETAIAEHVRTVNYAALGTGQRRQSNVEDVVAHARDIEPGETVLLLQPRLEVELGDWLLRGDVDVLRLERAASGSLQILIADIKSSTAAKVEHRLQVAFYAEMLAALLDEQHIQHAPIELGILYRGPVANGEADGAATTRRVEQEADCERLFGSRVGLLEIIPDAESYLQSVRDLVSRPRSTANRVVGTSFESLPFHLTYKCDGCLYNEFCMKWSAEHDDLSLLPQISEHDKRALRRVGITTTRQLAELKHFADQTAPRELVPAPGNEALVGQLATTWPIGPRLDELIHRARRYRRWKGDDLQMLTYIPSKGYGSLPYCDAGHNPNLLRVYIDAQHDYLHDRIYMLGALVVACEGGVEDLARRRSVVALAPRAPDSPEIEEQLLLGWINETVRAIVELVVPDEQGQPRAPIHLIFWNRFEQRLLLDSLARHFKTIAGATPVYDFLTQLAAFDSPVATFLDREIAELKNYPMVCQSLQTVAAFLGFDWNKDVPYRDLFRTRMFDFWGKLDALEGTGQSAWYTSRSRFNSQIPLEYAYAAWGDLATSSGGSRDELAAYRAATPELLRGFHLRRLEAIEHVAHDFRGNRQTVKSAFDLSDLAAFSDKARTLAHALDEFVTIERHVELEQWKSTRLLPPERRALLGETLLVRYVESDQQPDVASANRENERRRLLNEQYRAEYMRDHPNAKQVRLPREQRTASEWDQGGLRVRLRLETTELDCGLDELLGLSTLRPGDMVVLFARWTVDERLPPDEQTPFTPTPKQMLYGTRATVLSIVVERDEHQRAVHGYVELELRPSFGGRSSRGFLFPSRPRPLIAGAVYTLDPDPNNVYGFWCAKVTEELCAAEDNQATVRNELYERLTHLEAASAAWSPRAAEAQARFLAGLDALHSAGALHGFEPGKREFIGSHGATPVLLVQGPPGTGKSYSTAFALLARMQGAMADRAPFRAFVSCKTHAATDVLLHKVVVVQAELRLLSINHPEIFDRFIDRRLLETRLYRARGRNELPDPVIPLRKKDERTEHEPDNLASIAGETWCIVGATPGAVYGMVKEQQGPLFGQALCDCLVLDEASQMNLPEAVMAALLLKTDAQLLVVGDHRQMPPIVKHDWRNEPRRTFQQYQSYESLFETLLPLRPPMIKFEESFRLHADMAEFLRREIYSQDGIDYHSVRRSVLDLPDGQAQRDPFVRAVLAPEQTIVVVVHDEADSQVRNRFEQELISPLLEALANEDGYGLGPEHGLGVVVPHRAQRAALQEALPALSRKDEQSGVIAVSAVDTVERFQGGERSVILVSATESDRGYLLAAGDFLLDPRRLTVALSRAKRKIVLVAARSVFEMFSSDEDTFAHSQLWKNLLRRTCTISLWQGERNGIGVEVWGNQLMSDAGHGHE